MERVPVDSSVLASVGYDAPAATLELEFRSGDVYRYEGFPASEHAALMLAPSKGEFFAQRIRNEGYPYRRVREGSKRR